MDDRGLALWRAVADAGERFTAGTDDVMGVGSAGSEVVVIRVHVLKHNLFDDATVFRRPIRRRIG